MKLHEQYDALKKAHNLPPFEEMDLEFELYSIEQDEFLLKNILKKMNEKIEHYAKLLEDILHPEANLAAMHECEAFSPEERQHIFKIYTRLLFNHRQALKLDLCHDENKCAEQVVFFFHEWQDIKLKLYDIVEKIQMSWTREYSEISDNEYFG